MPTDYTDQFYTFDPASPPPVGTAVSVSVFTMTDENDDDDIDRFNNDSLDGSDITASWPGDTVTINVSGIGNVTYTGITFYLADGRMVFTPTDGAVLQDGTFVSSTFVNTQGPVDVDDLGPPCFTSKTLIRTPSGEIPIEKLQVGDFVETLDRGPQAIIWSGSRIVKGLGRLAPIEFAANSYGNQKKVRLSQQHRVLVFGWRCELYFAQSEMLVAAKHLVDGQKVNVVNAPKVEYFHIMFPNHEIVWANGMLCESFNPNGKIARQNRELVSELNTLFPEICRGYPDGVDIARPVARRHEAKLLQYAGKKICPAICDEPLNPQRLSQNLPHALRW